MFEFIDEEKGKPASTVLNFCFLNTEFSDEVQSALQVKSSNCFIATT